MILHTLLRVKKTRNNPLVAHINSNNKLLLNNNNKSNNRNKTTAINNNNNRIKRKITRKINEQVYYKNNYDKSCFY